MKTTRIFRAIMIIACMIITTGLQAQDINSKAKAISVKTIKVGDTLTFTGTIHASVGLEYEIEYDNNAFKTVINEEVLSPEKMNMPGADKHSVTYSLTATKAGKFNIKEYELFRGDKRLIKTTKVIVNQAKANAKKKTINGIKKQELKSVKQTKSQTLKVGSTQQKVAK